jgi:predicted RNase H-like HicB family nuclease
VKYTVVFEKAPNNWSAYVPDLPGCVSAAKTRSEIETMIKEAIEFHLEGMAEDGEPAPEAVSYAKDIEVNLPSKDARKAS